MLVPTRCPLDGPPESDVEVYPANFDATAFNPDVFSARREPDRLHYRMVRNLQSGTLRADPILDEESLQRLYSQSSFSYDELASFARDSYIEYLTKAVPFLPGRRAALEIGCGNGFFLEALLAEGFEDVRGIEPSADARAKAGDSVRDGIVGEPLKRGLFPEESFSLICGFQVLDHLSQPNDVLSICRELLAPGGVMYWICHDVGSLPARLLGARCPIIDIEHIVLYDRSTLPRLFARNGLEPLEVFGVKNRYPLRYWMQLMPSPPRIKRALLAALDAVRLGRIPIKVNLGNMGIVARRSEVQENDDSN